MFLQGPPTIIRAMDSEVAIFGSAARAFAGLVHEIPESAWDGPGLGAWDLRSLVGHTSLSLSTVGSYRKRSAEREDVSSAADYYALVRRLLASNAAIAARNEEWGRTAGRELGEDPAASVDSLVERALSDLVGVEDSLIGVTGRVGIRLQSYVPTRTFELAVHSLDIARAASIPFVLPADVLAEVTVLSAAIAVVNGQAQEVLLSLTGRNSLPPSFSVL